jgi:hypothetical protein
MYAYISGEWLPHNLWNIPLLHITIQILKCKLSYKLHLNICWQEASSNINQHGKGLFSSVLSEDCWSHFCQMNKILMTTNILRSVIFLIASRLAWSSAIKQTAICFILHCRLSIEASFLLLLWYLCFVASLVFPRQARYKQANLLLAGQD